MTHYLMQKTPKEFKWDLWNARIISIWFYTFVTLKWRLISTPQKSMKNVHSGMKRISSIMFAGQVSDFSISRRNSINSSVDTASDWKARHNADAGSSPWCDTAFFFQSPFLVQTLLWCPHSRSVQSHWPTSECTLKIPNTLFGHENTAHADRNG